MFYKTKDVAKMLSVSEAQVRGFVRAGFLTPETGPRGEHRFSFADLVIMRTAKGLLASRVPAAKVKRALKKLLTELPTGRPLTGVKIAAEGSSVVVHEEGARYDPLDGQLLFDFGVRDLVKKVAPLARKTARAAVAAATSMSSEDWYVLACELEISSINEARDAYRRAIELDPTHADALTNLGRLLHETGELGAAEAHYRQALSAVPDHDTAWFNLGIALEDQGKLEDGASAYERALSHDPNNADAHFNAARIYEILGRPMLALRHLRAYQKLTR
jgi:tetratricopeptide (TPR) repeat protein